MSDKTDELLQKMYSDITDIKVAVAKLGLDVSYIKDTLKEHENRIKKIEDCCGSSEKKEQIASEQRYISYRRYSIILGAFMAIFTAVNVIIKLI